ncbi:hypothetical protein CRYPA_1892 [uncultured Candidatus Thioglobus sp.]|nr:hypothetical protein CRYPA_1892 [uncultured Candidatus Thioglobus sp.]
MKTIRWDTTKAKILRSDVSRGNIGFEDCIVALEENRVLDDIENPSKKYSNQRMFILGINNYAYVVPYIETRDEIFLKTVFPSRKHTAMYLTENK